MSSTMLVCGVVCLLVFSPSSWLWPTVKPRIKMKNAPARSLEIKAHIQFTLSDHFSLLCLCYVTPPKNILFNISALSFFPSNPLPHSLNILPCHYCDQMFYHYWFLTLTHSVCPFTLISQLLYTSTIFPPQSTLPLHWQSFKYLFSLCSSIYLFIWGFCMWKKKVFLSLSSWQHSVTYQMGG